MNRRLDREGLSPQARGKHMGKIFITAKEGRKYHGLYERYEEKGVSKRLSDQLEVFKKKV